MKKWIVVAAFICLAGGTASADVSHEVVVGLETDSTKKVETNAGVDLNGKLETKNSIFTVQYTHFFTPLKDDDKPIDLRQFYQHPSTLSAGLGFFKMEDKDYTTPGFETDSKASATILSVEGEYFLPTNTGLFLGVGFASGSIETKVGVLSSPDANLQTRLIGIGARQYLGRSAALHIMFEMDSSEAEIASTPSVPSRTLTIDGSVVYLGVRWVIAELVGLALEFGTGTREETSAGTTTKFDVDEVNIEVAGYFGKQFSVRFGLANEYEENTRIQNEAEDVTRMTLGLRYWFSEGFGLDLPIYSEKTTIDVGPDRTSVTNNGMGLYAAFRF